MKERDIALVFRRLGQVYRKLKAPVVTVIARKKRDPFLVLIATMLSLRTKDAVTKEASAKLFKHANTPETMLQLDRNLIASLIFPVGFFRQKARQIHETCRLLLDRHGGRVPADMDALLALPGVGRKTANLVLLHGFGIPAVCVDTHVHRITNRWGYVRTRTPEETEFALRERLPRRYWATVNDYLVAYGQNVCTPISPWCTTCVVSAWCNRVGVKKTR